MLTGLSFVTCFLPIWPLWMCSSFDLPAKKASSSLPAHQIKEILLSYLPASRFVFYLSLFSCVCLPIPIFLKLFHFLSSFCLFCLKSPPPLSLVLSSFPLFPCFSVWTTTIFTFDWSNQSIGPIRLALLFSFIPKDLLAYLLASAVTCQVNVICLPEFSSSSPNICSLLIMCYTSYVVPKGIIQT